MRERAEPAHATWQTKPTDRFVLKWIKTRLSARVTPHLIALTWLQPWMITLLSAALGIAAGIIFALGRAWLAGCVAAVAQVFDGVDGQYARFTGRQSRGGAFWDSVLDRYADGALVIGMVIYLIRTPQGISPTILLLLGALAVVGSNLVSYSTARADTLDLDVGRPTLASKGTRTCLTILCAWGTLLWSGTPLIALLYLAAHPNLVVLGRLLRVRRDPPAAREKRE